MKKQFLNLGQFLSKVEQKSIFGGRKEFLVHCNNGYDFSVNPNGFNPNQVCAAYGGYSHMTLQ